MKKTLLQIFEENNLLESPETEQLIIKIDQIIKQDEKNTTLYRDAIRRNVNRRND